MNRITFEMLAKWIAKHSGAKVVFDGVVKGATTNMKTNEILMPQDLKEHNIFAALALLMHEGGHIKYSKQIPEKFYQRSVTKNIMNAMEDIRVDLKNYRELYNIKDFYDRLIEDHVYTRRDELVKSDLLTRVLINCIMDLTYHRKFDNDTEAIEFEKKNKVNDLVIQGVNALEYCDWNKLQVAIDRIKEIFNIKEEDDAPVPMMGVGDDNSLGNTGKFMSPGSAWDKGEGIKGPSRDVIGEAAFQDLTRESFKELLNIKEKRTIYDGQRLDTDSLPAFLTGDIDELFKDDAIERIKKSKISFCLDASGSMSSRLIDNNSRTDVLIRTVRSIINILKELQETEGLNIKYDIWAFDYNATKLNEDNWEREYTTHGGGTNLLQAFLDVQDAILKDQELDGNKMVVLITDGEVSSQEIDELKTHIVKHGAEVKCMVIGIGANLQGRFVETIAGDNNIIAQEHSDAVLMDAIKVMLE